MSVHTYVCTCVCMYFGVANVRTYVMYIQTTSVTPTYDAAYANLVSEMWSEEEGGAVSPHAFKSQIQKYARRFMGYE